ncbi:copper resistance D family protein [Paenibacillus yanchengensis]|uniref:Copper resistance D family protein n=1 Tax=Paenibacillus yanchengensis TaxID=2035833 RepID=A0ABW4YLV4_9BACL
MLYVTEGLLYISFAIITGALILSVVPETKRPAIAVPSWLVSLAIIAIPILSFAPIHQLTSDYVVSLDMSYGEMVKVIILDFNMGKSWLWTTIGSIGLLLITSLKLFRNDRKVIYAALFILVLLFVWLGYSSHSASILPIQGLIAHTLHFMAVSVWIGILFVISWFSTDNNNWSSFLRWFSPVAIIAVTITIVAGLVLMTIVSPQYLNAWMLPYGQWMLLKHLLLIPLLLFALSNGFIYPTVIKQHPHFKPVKWLRLESIIALLVLFVTAIMGEQAPPHNVQDTLQYYSPSGMFTSLYRGNYTPDLQLTLTFTMESILMLIAAAIMAYTVVWSYRKQYPYAALGSGLLATVFGYFGLMFAIA